MRKISQLIEYLSVMASAFSACLALLFAIGGQVQASVNMLYATVAAGALAAGVIALRSRQ